ncbi:hypothetical protein ABE85_04285 [Mitsuaria sp. 7]|nr:hypothetical protein ABE85_04285 [Mitsuaria sp. 7]
MLSPEWRGRLAAYCRLAVDDGAVADVLVDDGVDVTSLHAAASSDEWCVAEKTGAPRISAPVSAATITPSARLA